MSAFRQTRCEHCKGTHTNYVGNRNGFEVFKCYRCKKYTSLKSNRVIKPLSIKESIPPCPEKEKVEQKDIIICSECKNPIEKNKVRKGTKTCSKECSKARTKRKKAEYHVERKKKKESNKKKR